MIAAMVGANGAGAVAVVTFAIVVLSDALGLREISAGTRMRDGIVAVVYVAFASVAGPVWSLRGGRRLREARESGCSPTDEERRLALAGPVRHLEINTVMWGGGAALFVAVGAPDSWRFAITGAVAILLGGLVTCTVAYLLSERLLRDSIALSLAGRPPPGPVRRGVATRLLIAGVLAAGVPLLAIALLALAVLSDHHLSATRLATLVLALALTGLCVSLIAIRLVSRSIADPLDSMRGALARVRAGDTSVAVDVYDGSEVGLLQAGFNHMVSGLREREQLADLFGRHVGVDVARRALRRGVELGGETRAVSVLLIDISRSTELVANEPPGEVVELLNRFFAVVIDAVTEHSGWINKFVGDAALCIFGAPVDDPEAATHALAAARVLNERLAAQIPEIAVGTGVAHGDVVAGNIGAAERFEYTVVGDPVNEAARLSELAKRERTALASAAVLSLAAPAESSQWELGGEAGLRGRSAPTALARPRSSRPWPRAA